MKITQEKSYIVTYNFLFFHIGGKAFVITHNSTVWSVILDKKHMSITQRCVFFPLNLYTGDKIHRQMDAGVKDEEKKGATTGVRSLDDDVGRRGE